MVSVLQPARAMIDPLDGLGVAVESRRWAWPLIALSLCVSFSAAAFALRWDATVPVTRQLQMQGEFQNTTEQELAQQIVTAERVKLVSGVAKGLFVMPLMVLVLAAVLKGAGWMFGTPARFEKCFSAAAIATLPIALYHLIFGFSALRQPALTEMQLDTLVPSSLAVAFPKVAPAVRRVLGALDFFNLWSVAMLGLGFAAASGMRRGRALLLGLGLYAMYVGLVVIALPGMMGGPK